MEQHMQSLMWLKSEQILKSQYQYQALMNTFNNSREEQAFAEDAAGPLGGFAWPPRSYSCTFCGREFRSAQALGGHMNVHRRDRARLKQSLSSKNDQAQLQKHNDTPSMLPVTQHSPQGGGLYPPFSSASRASPKITHENSSVQSYVSPPFSSFITKEQQRWLGYPSSPLGSDSNSIRILSISNCNTGSGKCTRKEHITLDHEHTVETTVSVGINLGDSHNLQLGSHHEETINSKRRKSTAISSFPFFHKPCSSDRQVVQSEVLRIRTNSLEDIDLELRLGDPPAVK